MSQESHCFEYNSKMCFTDDAKTWNGLGDVKATDVLNPNEFIIIDIEENGTATDITISYENDNERVIICANNLSFPSLTMTINPNRLRKANRIYSVSGAVISIVSKWFGKWQKDNTN